MRDDNCIFCKIANGEIPSATLYEDEEFRVILDLGPASKGHALILPKNHYRNLYDIDEATASKAICLAKKMITKMTDVLGCDGYNIVQNNEEAAGQTIGVIGGTGSGKSSLVGLIPRFYDVTEGEVLIDGVNVKDISIEELRDKVGIVMQKAVLFKGSIRKNMQMAKQDATDSEIDEALAIAQAKEFVDKKDGRLDYMIEQGGKNLSGGQRQRLTIARAVVKKPDVLILDDSASALDFATDAALRKSIRTMPNNPTVFIVSQRSASLMHADKIIVLDDGKVAGIGTHSELLKNCEVYREIYNSQFKDAKGA